MNFTLPTILVLDDEPDLLELLSALLTSADYRMQAVQTADDMERYLREAELPVLFVLDLLLSGSSGDELARHLKEAGRTRDVPILMISAHPSAEREARAAGADAFLAKPFDIDEFLSLVSSLLARPQAEPIAAKDQERTQPELLPSSE